MESFFAVGGADCGLGATNVSPFCVPVFLAVPSSNSFMCLESDEYGARQASITLPSGPKRKAHTVPAVKPDFLASNMIRFRKAFSVADAAPWSSLSSLETYTGT